MRAGPTSRTTRVSSVHLGLRNANPSTRFRAAGLRDEALEMPTLQLGVLLVGLVLIGLPVWGAVDAATHPESTWQRVGLRRRRSRQ
jgi:hypothetical protein